MTESIESFLLTTRILIGKILVPVLRFVFVFFIVAIAWYGFLKLIEVSTDTSTITIWYDFLFLRSKPVVDTSSALVMAWVSVLILFIGANPSILERIKRVKVKDIEVELQQAVENTVTKEYISQDDFVGEYFLSSNKGNWETLWLLYRSAIRQPFKQILLKVDLKRDDHINRRMLYVYLAILDLVNISTIVIFFSSRDRRQNVMGVINGKKVKQGLEHNNPSFFGIYRDIELLARNECPTYGEFRDKINIAYNHMQEDADNTETDFMSKREIIAQFGSDLSTTVIQRILTKDDVLKVRKSILTNDQYLLVYDDDTFHSIISINILTRNISKKVLLNLPN